MTKQSTRKDQVYNADLAELYAAKLVERFDSFSTTLERSLTRSFDSILNVLLDIQEAQKLILNRMAGLERSVALLTQKTNKDSDLLHCTVVRVRADSDKTDGKARRIAWIGIGEMAKRETRLLDQEILKAVVYTSGAHKVLRGGKYKPS
ncbi:unnamed protein product [Heligmosomoides polygyrus]|uniref:DNA replication initiation control protein YabA n=1 Tax=Heligmosomoides polygyrus TaxID=6339 RepID=A0A183GV84_HELPZ|nr:unnamed protein product [Heligmosomoides polygyrus]